MPRCLFRLGAVALRDCHQRSELDPSPQRRARHLVHELLARPSAFSGKIGAARSGASVDGVSKGWRRIFEGCQMSELHFIIVDSTIVRARQPAADAGMGPKDQALWPFGQRSRLHDGFAKKGIFSLLRYLPQDRSFIAPRT